MGKNRTFTTIRLAAIAAALPFLLHAFPDGPPPGMTGAPGESTCRSCHSPGAGGGKAEIAFQQAFTYTPGVKQQLTIIITDTDAQLWGFELSARLAADNSQAGRLDPAPGESNIRVICANGVLRGDGACPAGSGVEYIEHSRPRQTNMFRLEWTPPSTASGPVRIYVAANAANGDEDPTGDDIYIADYTLTPQDQPTGAPRINSAGVVNGASFAPEISPGSFISIFGENLAPVTRSWDGAILGTALPSQLEGVSVTVGGKPTYLAYMVQSPGQLNVLLPTEDIAGSVEVKVTTPQGSSSAAAVIQKYAPGFFRSSLDNRYVTATHADNVLVARVGQTPGVTSRPALPGEVIVLWGSGFGPTAEPVPSGQVLGKAYPLANLGDLKVAVGGMNAPVAFAGVTLAGVYQTNVVVPADLPDGDHTVLAEIGGARTQDNAFIAVERPAGGLARIEVSIKLDVRFTQGTYMGDRWVSPPVFGPVAQEGTALSLDLRADGVASNGQRMEINPQWIPSDPQMVTVSPIEGSQTTMTVQRAGESSLRVAAQGIEKILTIKSRYQDSAIVVEIIQQ